MSIAIGLQILYVLGVFSITFLSQIIIGKFVKLYYNKIAKKTKSKFDDEMLPLIGRIMAMGIWIIGLVLILLKFGIDLKGLTATLGVGSLAIALAVKDNVKDIISGLSLMASKPFKIGDRIKLSSGEEVSVIEIGMSDTRFLLLDEKDEVINDGILIVRNSVLNKSKILNYTMAENYDG